jgi:5-formyltetrahydrofolate cyclo-ligase
LSKPTLRKELRALRRSLPRGEHAARSTLAAACITRSKRFKAGARVAIYLPFDRETDTATLLAAAQRRGIRVFVPVVTDLRHRRMSFHPWSGRTRRGAFGISVPHRQGRPIGARWFDLIVVPLVGADPTGCRLGVGGGFYDRALAFRRMRRHWMGPCLLGLGFDRQRVDCVFADPWDVRLDGLATESGLEQFPENPLRRS